MKNLIFILTIFLLISLFPIEKAHAIENNNSSVTIENQDVKEEIFTKFIKSLPASSIGTIGVSIFLLLKHNKANKKISTTKYLKRNGYTVISKKSEFIKSEKRVVKDFYKK